MVPCFNEEGAIHGVLDHLRETLKGQDYELIVVDDGSTDETPRLLKEYPGASEIRVLTHNGSFGEESRDKARLTMHVALRRG